MGWSCWENSHANPSLPVLPSRSATCFGIPIFPAGAPHATLGLGDVETAFQLEGTFCHLDWSFWKCSELPHPHPRPPSSILILHLHPHPYFPRSSSSPSSISTLHPHALPQAQGQARHARSLRSFPAMLNRTQGAEDPGASIASLVEAGTDRTDTPRCAPDTQPGQSPPARGARTSLAILLGSAAAGFQPNFELSSLPAGWDPPEPGGVALARSRPHVPAPGLSSLGFEGKLRASGAPAQRERRKQGKRAKQALFHQTAFALLFSRPETTPSPADSAQIPPRVPLGSPAMPTAPWPWGCAGGSCPSLLPAAAAGPCRAVMRLKPLSRRERGWQRGAGGAWMLSQHLPLGRERQRCCLGILPPLPRH